MTIGYPSQSGSAAAGTRPYIEMLIGGLEHAGASPVIRYQGQDTTAAAFAASIYQYARVLAGLGIARGELVTLFAPIRIEALAIRYAVNLIGAAAVYLSAPASP